MELLQARDITFSYDEEQVILQSLDFSLSEGEIVILGGPTGSGKSTLAKILTGYIPRRIEGQLVGNVYIDGENSQELTIPQIAKRVSLVQQDVESQLCTLRVADEVAFGPENFCEDEDEIIERVNQGLESVGILHLKNRSTMALSGGEKQRLAVASILSMQPDYLILDEPSSSLDPQGVSKLRQNLIDLKQNGLGILIIEHKVKPFLPIADRTLKLHNKIITRTELSGSTRIQRKPRANYPKPEAKTTLLRCDGLSFSYDNSKVISDLSAEFHKDEVVALMGNNGSGKSTFISLLAGVLEPSAGSILLDGLPIDKAPRNNIVRTIAMVFQNPNHQIFESTVWDEQNIIFDVLETLENGQSKSRSLLSDANLYSMRERNPFSLSYGQKRRLNVTSTTAHEPRILLLDEPFIGQDKRGRNFILERINDIKKGGLVIVITHESQFAVDYCDRLVFMDQGTILLDGPPAQVLDRLESVGFPEYSEIGGMAGD
jgi:energy-coupling factor transport system ATP-binding protein